MGQTFPKTNQHIYYHESQEKAGQHLKVGICGEHGGDPESVKFCHKIGPNYVSCSPFRLLTARLAAAQAAVEEQNGSIGTGNK